MAALKNPFDTLNNLYAKTIQSVHTKRPFTSIETPSKKSTTVKLILLPHQTLILPKSLANLMTVLHDPDELQFYDNDQVK